MTKMQMIMKRGHEIARTLEGDYSARMSFALKMAWAETKVEEITVFEVKCIIEEALEEKHSNLFIYESAQKDSVELTVKAVEYKRGRRNETILSRLKLNQIGSIEITYDRTGMLSDALKNVRVYDVETLEVKFNRALNTMLESVS